MSDEVLNLDKLIQDKRIVKLAGKKIDVTKIPSKVTLKVVDIYEEISRDDPESFDKVFDIVMMVIKSQNDDIDKDWLIENSTIDQLIELVEFIMKPINERIEEKSSGTKN